MAELNRSQGEIYICGGREESTLALPVGSAVLA